MTVADFPALTQRRYSKAAPGNQGGYLPLRVVIRRHRFFDQFPNSFSADSVEGGAHHCFG